MIVAREEAAACPSSAVTTVDILAGLIKDEAGIAVLHIPDGCITDLFNAVPRLLEDLMVKQWRQYRGGEHLSSADARFLTLEYRPHAHNG